MINIELNHYRHSNDLYQYTMVRSSSYNHKNNQQGGSVGAPFHMHQFGAPGQVPYDVMYGLARVPSTVNVPQVGGRRTKSSSSKKYPLYNKDNLTTYRVGTRVRLVNGRIAKVVRTKNGKKRLQFVSA